MAAANAEEKSDRIQRMWQPHTVRQYRSDKLVDIPARAQATTDPQAWGHSFLYMPDKNRLLLQTGDLEFYSDNLGNNWITKTTPALRHFTYLGNGNVLGRTEKMGRLLSNDYGITWHPFAPVPSVPGQEVVFGSMGPDLVDKTPSTGNVVRLAESVDRYIRFSTDGGLTWPTVIDAPWCSETVLARAGNGDIVAATRTSTWAGYIEATGTNVPDTKTISYDRWRVGTEYDFYCGFGIHISKDDGHTWSPIKQLYMHGRHHASIVLMPNNDLVMSYVVRLGYEDTPDGLPQYGIEAMVSHDHGQSWDLEHRYVLDKWRGEWADHPGGLVKLMAPNETYTVILRDGSLITSFERGVQEAGVGYHRQLKLIHWQLHEEPKAIRSPPRPEP